MSARTLEDLHGRQAGSRGYRLRLHVDRVVSMDLWNVRRALLNRIWEPILLPDFDFLASFPSNRREFLHSDGKGPASQPARWEVAAKGGEGGLWHFSLHFGGGSWGT